MSVREDEQVRQGATDDRQYVAPEVTRLGTLAELTHGGTVGTSDGTGHAGSSGSI
jgi:hypothetical protein